MDVWGKAGQNTNKVERKLVVGTMQSRLFSWKGKNTHGVSGKAVSPLLQAHFNP